MQLIGMLDSPYVRRVAVSLQLLGLRFEHQPLSVFRTFDEFSRINPVVKAPTLVCDSGSVLMDSTLILQYAEALAAPRSLMPSEPAALERALRVLGLALAAGEKSVQIVYERGLRPPEKLHEPWVRRVTGQLLAAFGGLEREYAGHVPALSSRTIQQCDVTSAVIWHFVQQMLPEIVEARAFPALAALSAAAEALPEFQAAPHGAGTCQGAA